MFLHDSFCLLLSRRIISLTLDFNLNFTHTLPILIWQTITQYFIIRLFEWYTRFICSACCTQTVNLFLSIWRSCSISITSVTNVYGWFNLFFFIHFKISHSRRWRRLRCQKLLALLYLLNFKSSLRLLHYQVSSIALKYHQIKLVNSLRHRDHNVI